MAVNAVIDSLEKDIKTIEEKMNDQQVLIDLARAAGENVTESETNLKKLKIRHARWKNALQQTKERIGTSGA